MDPGVMFVIKAVFWLALDGLLETIKVHVMLLNVGQFTVSIAEYLGLLPPQMIYLIKAIALPQGLSILVWAIAVRMALNLVPSWITRL